MVLQSWKYLGSKLGRLFKKKKKRRKLSCCPRFNWTEPRTRLTGPTSDRSVPDTTRRFIYSRLRGRNAPSKRISVLKDETRRFLNESYTVGPLMGHWTRVLDIRRRLDSRVLLNGAGKDLCLASSSNAFKSFDFKLAFFLYEKFFK